MNEDNIYNLQYGGEFPLDDNMLDALAGGAWCNNVWDGIKDTAQNVADAMLVQRPVASF